MKNIPAKMAVLNTDITKVKVDAIVNAANSSLLGGGGVDGAIHRAGGPRILAGCKQIIAKQGSCKTGEAVITSAGNLSAKYVIHTVGPVWPGKSDSGKEKSQKLANCYINSLHHAIEHQCKSVAFPNISTGVYGFPKAKAAKIAVESVSKFLERYSEIENVIFVCFDAENETFIRQQLLRIEPSFK